MASAGSTMMSWPGCWPRRRGWSRAAAGLLAAVSALAALREAEAQASRDWRGYEHVQDEIAITLTLTRPAAARILDLALSLDRLPLTRAALAAGQIDERRAAVIADEISDLDDEHAAAVEALIITKAATRPPGSCGPPCTGRSSPPTRPPRNGGRRSPEAPGGNLPGSVRHRQPHRPGPAPRRRPRRRQAPDRPRPRHEESRTRRHHGPATGPRLPPPPRRWHPPHPPDPTPGQQRTRRRRPHPEAEAHPVAETHPVAEAHPQTRHPQTAHPRTANPVTAHPRTAHPRTANPVTAHPQTAHPGTAPASTPQPAAGRGPLDPDCPRCAERST